MRFAIAMLCGFAVARLPLRLRWDGVRNRSARSAAGLAVAVVVLVLGLGGCKSAEAYREDATATALEIIENKQRAALGEAEDFDVRPAAADLRKRLLLDQGLRASFVASPDTRDVEPIDELSDRGYLTASDDRPAPPWLDRAGEGPMVITLEEALQIGARNSRSYQSQKEQVFFEALDLDLEREAFRTSWAGLLSSEAIRDLGADPDVSGLEHTGELSLRRRFKTGVLMTARLGVDLAQLLTGSESSSLGVFGDASVSIPLLRGSGRFMVTEPLKQAERDVVYAIYALQRFRRSFAVDVASSYFGVLEQLDRVVNAEENYRGLINSARRAQRLADMGRLPEIQVDQAVQDELRARDRWVGALQGYEAQLDRLKLVLGLPTDARIALDRDAFERLTEQTAELIDPTLLEPEERESVAADAPIDLDPPTLEGGGPWEIDPELAIVTAFNHRLDLRTSLGRVDDAQRGIVVAADDLRADLTLLGSMSVGERRGLGGANRDDASLRLDEGRYSGLLTLDLPLERTAERNRYRESWIALEQRVRDAQELEDQIKLDTRSALRTLLQSRESIGIQARSVRLAERRVRSTELFLEQGRAEIRDVLEARESLISARNALTAALVDYRIAELELQRDLGVLEVAADGLWRELTPELLESRLRETRPSSPASPEARPTPEPPFPSETSP